ncbi:hypothetical protein CASFOL_018528 [Castilleja foliolosa]|uniref:Uncharacterized protein n=1 Tax=Castilleja foliolosa TaxID=1961234 RepID=A0ABD3D7I1_9LAMI
MVEQEMRVDKLGMQSNYHPYPSPLTTYEDVVASRDLFMDTLKKFHASMGTKFMIPIVGGRDLDLHRLFVEVTSRGGVTKVLKEKRWREAKCWTPSPTDTMQHLSTVTSTQGPSEQQTHAPQNNIATSLLQEPKALSAGSPVCGVIDGKFDSGYLITVKIGSEEFKGVLYQVPSNETQTLPISSTKPVMTRRKRRKKSEIRKRDPAHPKPNRSGYNFYFAEQHARLKPLYHGKDREISRIIGQTWTKLNEPERAVYQEKALKDKERYKIEMEGYRERLRTGQIVRGATMPTHHRPEINLTDLNTTYLFEGEDNEMCSEMKSDKSGSSEEYESSDKELDFGECSKQLKNVNIEVVDDDVAFTLQTRPERNDENNKTLAGDGVPVPIEEMEQSLGNNIANVSFPSL